MCPSFHCPVRHSSLEVFVFLLTFIFSYLDFFNFVLFGGSHSFVLCYFPRISAGAGTLTPLAPITLQEMKLDPSMAAYQQGKLRVNEV
jgi:hypothetical protein